MSFVYFVVNHVFSSLPVGKEERRVLTTTDTKGTKDGKTDWVCKEPSLSIAVKTLSLPKGNPGDVPHD